MKPLKSYRIWFSQRNGSTLLCKGLEQTGIAGKPGEFFNVMNSDSLCEEHQVEKSFSALRDKIWSLGTTENKIFGIKHSMHTSRHMKIFKEISELQGIPFHSKINTESLLEELFPNCKHIFLTRRNKVRQAVSWWKAIKDNTWHLEKNKTHSNDEAFYENHYDFNAINHLFNEASLRECSIQAYFDKYEISPLTFVYEDFIQNFESTIHSIIDYLDIDKGDLKIKPMYYSKTANSKSEIWVQQFRKDLQSKMDVQIW